MSNDSNDSNPAHAILESLRLREEEDAKRNLYEAPINQEYTRESVNDPNEPEIDDDGSDDFVFTADTIDLQDSQSIASDGTVMMDIDEVGSLAGDHDFEATIPQPKPMLSEEERTRNIQMLESAKTTPIDPSSVGLAIDLEQISSKVTAADTTKQARKDVQRTYSYDVPCKLPDSSHERGSKPEYVPGYRIVVDARGNEHKVPVVNEFGMTPYEAAKYVAEHDESLKQEIQGLQWHLTEEYAPNPAPKMQKVMLRRGHGYAAQYMFGHFAYFTTRGHALFIIDGSSAKLPRRADYWCPIPKCLLI